MSIANLLNGLSSTVSQPIGFNHANSTDNPLRSIASRLPGGLAGGALAGGLVALLASNKSARKFTGKAVKYGGTAILGGLAYKAYKNWQQPQAGTSSETMNQGQLTPASQSLSQTSQRVQAVAIFEEQALAHMNGAQVPKRFELTLIKAMICAASVDGNIDNNERQNIFSTIEKLDMDGESKSELLELFLTPITIDELVSDLESMEEKAEVYLASCLAIKLDHQAEYVHLSNLSKALNLPSGLEHELRLQAKDALVVEV